MTTVNSAYVPEATGLEMYEDHAGVVLSEAFDRGLGRPCT